MSQINARIPKVLAVHDMSGYGKCSLTVVLPVISACGVEVCPLPTALLSSSINFKGFVFVDFTDKMPEYINHWADIGIEADAIYSGFLGSEMQIDYIIGMKNKFPGAIAIIDPVMGDNGVIYKTYTPQMCEKMKELAAVADILTPNLTEACVLTDRRYEDADTSSSGIEMLAREIAAMGAKSVVVTGIERGDVLYNCVLTEDGKYIELPHKLYPERMHGTGDLFTSVLTGGIVTGHSLVESVESAAEFVYNVVEHTQMHFKGCPQVFEPFLWSLRGGVCKG